MAAASASAEACLALLQQVESAALVERMAATLAAIEQLKEQVHVRGSDLQTLLRTLAKSLKRGDGAGDDEGEAAAAAAGAAGAESYSLEAIVAEALALPRHASGRVDGGWAEGLLVDFEHLQQVGDGSHAR